MHIANLEQMGQSFTEKMYDYKWYLSRKKYNVLLANIFFIFFLLSLVNSNHNGLGM